MSDARRRRSLPDPEFAAWSRAWEAARWRAGLLPLAIIGTGTLGGIVLSWTVLDRLVSRNVGAGIYLAIFAGSRLVIRNGGRCARCGAAIYDPAG